jgi:hypothetical protein
MRKPTKRIIPLRLVADIECSKSIVELVSHEPFARRGFTSNARNSKWWFYFPYTNNPKIVIAGFLPQISYALFCTKIDLTHLPPQRYHLFLLETRLQHA